MHRIARAMAFVSVSILIASSDSFAAGRRPQGPVPAPPGEKAPPAPPPLPVTVLSAPAGEKASAPSAVRERPVAVAPVPPTATPRAATPSGPQPRIVFESLLYNFGEAIGVEKVEHVFRFRNEGRADLLVDKVSTTCGCTAALISSKVVPPGGAGEISTAFTVGERQGKQIKHINVYSNDPVEPKLCLTLEGTVVPSLSVEPPTVFLQDRPGESSRVVRISQTLPQELTLGEPVTRLNLVTAVLREEPPEGGKKRYTLEVALKPEVEPGRHFENVSMPTNYAAKPTLQIPVRLTVRGEIAVQPSRISLGQLQPGQEIARSITVSSTRDREFMVLKAEIDNAAFRISPEVPPAPAKSYTFTVTGAPESETGGVRAKAIFTLDHPKQRTIEVPIYGWLRRSAPPATPRPFPREGSASPAPSARP